MFEQDDLLYQNRGIQGLFRCVVLSAEMLLHARCYQVLGCDITLVTTGEPSTRSCAAGRVDVTAGDFSSLKMLEEYLQLQLPERALWVGSHMTGV